MSNAFAKEALKICVAQICQNIGWHAVQSSPLEILVDVIHRYLSELSKSVHGYSTQYNRTIPNLDDLGLAFKDFGINVPDIEEYVNNVEPVPFVQKVAAFPVKHPSNLQYPKTDSRELSLRPEHIPEYLPLMHPELEEEDGHFSSHSSADGVKKNVGDPNNIGGDSPSPINSPKHGTKRTGDWTSEMPSKKPRYYTEEEGRPMREVTSVFMSPAGFISPVHEGKTADSSLPCLVDSPPSSPEPPPHSFTPVIPKKESKSKDVKKEKSSKSKRDKEVNKKDSKKLKTSKREKENKENAVRKTEKVSSSSPSVKKEHSSSHKSSGKSEKSSRSDDSFRSRSKSEKAKLKARKEMHKIKDFKLSKSKSKLKHAMLSSSLKSPKLSNSKKFKSIKSPRMRSPKASIKKIPHSEPPAAVVPLIVPKVETEERKVYPMKEEEEKSEIKIEEPLIIDELDYREESPEPERLVIDDSIETQVRQEKESRLAIVDRCIEAVIKRGEEESEVESEKHQKALDDTINDVVRGPATMTNIRKLEPKDIYDFTDTSDSSSLSSSDIPPHSPICSPVKKEKKSSESRNRKSDSPKKNKQRKRGTKEPKVRSPTGFSSPKQKFSSSNFVLKVEDRTPSPSDLKDDLLSSDDSSPFPSPSPSSVFDAATPPADHMPTPPPFVPLSGSASSYSSSPFAPIRPMPCHLQANPHFPTPPLFVTPAKSESSTSFQSAQPLNLAKSSTPKMSLESKVFESNMLSSQSSKIDGSSDSKKSSNVVEKAKLRDHKKDKVDKKEKLRKRGRDKKESERVKEKKEKEEAKEKTKIKEKSKSKPEKIVKVDKRKTKLDKKRGKEKEEKFKEDSTVPKMTLKLSTGSCSTKIFIKSSSKNSSAGPSSPIPSDIEMPPTPSPPPHIPTPSPPRVATPPPPTREPTPSPPPAPPPAPSPPLPEPELEEESPPVAPPPVTKPTHSRGRGRGRKAAVQQAIPPARTVITETLGTIVDESGNKIWICPACSRADDGSPMIGCDGCDDWYHWICVGIVVPPKEEEEWYCSRCVTKRQGSTVKRRRKKHRKDK